ncbi:3-deoxy-D-manno-octulosonic-acid transferase [Marinospirillum celere]|uniref:3-deoxy-D-manno-octulosonic acid transferase n=1 Tax=Marinospirillum celere TaxID=1122252 RepID=A0A1I1I8V1_9GAMM|nr:lipid IV(A) 3-deoxy-D-manno-octulosonic acid transferase [Marinospirillum celere]SFC32202.1 3-deoxy-D-manno-octulosonic-acid transferase [Marinospirillum celere]
MSALPRYLYTGLLTLLSPLAKKRLEKEKVNELSARQRAGHISPSKKEVVWAHCASVGEVLAAEPLLNKLLQAYPEKQLVVTTMTATGAAQVRQRLPEARHYLLPLDLPWYADRFIHTLKPRLAIIFETEIWPNLLHSCKKMQVPVVVANGRLSNKAFKAYKKIRPLMAEALSKVDQIAAKAEEDAERFIALGFPKEKMQVTGSIKYDLQPPTGLQEQAENLRTEWGQRPVWIAASTHEGEDEPLLEVHKKLLESYPDALLLLVPRHPQRFEEVAELIKKAGFSFSRRSQQDPVYRQTQVYLCDTLGEMLLFYAAADLAFVAGSLVPIGGHNLLEPAALETPIITGPHLHNFAEIAALLRQAGGMQEISQVEELPELLIRLFQDTESCRQLTQAAAAVIEANRGALNKQWQLVESFLHD